MEKRAHTGEHMSAYLLLPLMRETEDGQLHIKEFVKLEAVHGRRQLLGGGGIMGRPQCLVEGQQVELPTQIVGKGFGHQLGALPEEGAGEMLHRARCESSLLHAFGDGIIGLHAHLAERKRGCVVQVGMSDRDAAVEHRRAAEDDIGMTQLEGAREIGDGIEPHQVHHVMPVREMSHQSRLAPLAHLLKAQKPPLHLDKRHIGAEFTDGIQAGTVDMLIRQIIQEVVPVGESQLVVQHLCPGGSDAGKIL